MITKWSAWTQDRGEREPAFEDLTTAFIWTHGVWGEDDCSLEDEDDVEYRVRDQMEESMSCGDTDPDPGDRVVIVYVADGLLERTTRTVRLRLELEE
jgi:hypothetical protein